MTAATPRVGAAPGPGPTAAGGPAGWWVRMRFLRAAEYYATLFFRFWKASIVTVVISPILYLMAMGLGVGSLVDDNLGSGGAALDGVPYLQFVAPGLMAANGMQVAVGGSLYPVLASVKWLRTAFGVVATPVRPMDIAFGLQTWLAFQIFCSACIFTVIIGIAGAVSSPWVVLAPFATALGGVAYSAPAAAWAIGRGDEQSFAVIFRLGVLPSFLLSGTFFPISQLPGPLQWLAAATPLWHAVQLVRGFTTGVVPVGATLAHVAVLVAYTVAGLWFGRREYAKRLYP